MYVDWSNPKLLYHGPEGEPNLWNAFFRQPAEAMGAGRTGLLRRMKLRQYIETTAYSPVFGALKGVIESYGGIPLENAKLGRDLCARFVQLRRHFHERLLELAANFLPNRHRWLAVHIRRGDKAIEAKVNFDLNDDSIMCRIVAQCRAWSCDGVFLCSDDAAMKERLTASLQSGPGLAVCVYPTRGSATDGKGLHFDSTIDGYTKAEDVVVETLLMARHCSGLLSTYSNVSAAAVYLSPHGYPYTTFWDPVLPPVDRMRRPLTTVPGGGYGDQSAMRLSLVVC